MKTVCSINDTRDYLCTVRAQGRSIAFVPTMGNLHDGHLSLVRKAQELADECVVSIYVNQLQFGPGEDYGSYPRTLEEDQALLAARGVQLVFAPSSREIYPEGAERHTVVRVDALDGMHCGKSRPRFFTGIATVVTRLFGIIQPDYAVFGEKDFQQLCVIRKMVNDLMLPVKVVGAPTVRAENGLALSSRNGYLSEEGRQTAATLYQTLGATREAIIAGDRNYDVLRYDALARLARAGLTPDYFNIASRHTLQPATPADKELVILAAAALDNTRLIDNVQIDL